MIRDTLVSKTEIVPAHKETSVILHCYTITDEVFVEDVNPNPNDGKRHKIRSFIIAYDDKTYPSVTTLKSMLTNAKITNHSNIKTSQDYGSKLGNFCPKCLAMVKKEVNRKFTWDL